MGANLSRKAQMGLQEGGAFPRYGYMFAHFCLHGENE